MQWSVLILATAIASPAIAQRSPSSRPPVSYDTIATRIVSALQPLRREIVLSPADTSLLPELTPALRRALHHVRARLELVDMRDVPRTTQQLNSTRAFIETPVNGPLPRNEAFRQWASSHLNRIVHFHWLNATVDASGWKVPSPNYFPLLLADALDIDSAASAQRTGD